MTNKGLGLAYVFAITNALIIGFSFLFTKNALAAADPLDTLAFRFIASFLVMSIPVLTGHIKLNYRGKPLGSLLVLALLYPTSFFTLQTFGLLHATSAEGGILIALTPVITMALASLFLREKTNLMQKLSILLSVFGVLFIFIMQGGSIDPTHIGGIVLLLLSGFAISGYNVQSRSLSKQFTPSELSYVMMGFGFVLFLLVSVGKHIATGTMGQFFHAAGQRSVCHRCPVFGHYVFLGDVHDRQLCPFQNRGCENERILELVDGRLAGSRRNLFGRGSVTVPCDRGSFDHHRRGRGEPVWPKTNQRLCKKQRLFFQVT
ncbi:UNVERIFIED_CONTAM: drug/metabolite transporter (DMT)-like permease [Brevibacillus sp. OAP136]